MSNILVIGGSSGIGLQSVKRLLNDGHSVTAFSRGAENMTFGHVKLNKISGDACEDDDVVRALDKHDTVIQALGVPANVRLLTGPISLFSRATDILVPAMEERGISRLIAVTGFGAGESKGSIHPLQRLPFQLVFGKAYADKSEQEARIKASSLDWTLVRPGVLTNATLCKSYRVRTKQSEWRNGVVSRASVADYIARAVTDAECVGQEPVLTAW